MNKVGKWCLGIALLAASPFITLKVIEYGATFVMWTFMVLGV